MTTCHDQWMINNKGLEVLKEPSEETAWLVDSLERIIEIPSSDRMDDSCDLNVDIMLVHLLSWMTRNSFAPGSLANTLESYLRH
jgi:hypothetical protein